MPMSFPEMKDLLQAADVHLFRRPNPQETEVEYRAALALHVRPIDRVESYEILYGVGWDQFTDDQNMRMLKDE